MGAEITAQSITVGVGQYFTALNTYGPMRSNTTADHWNRHAYIYPATGLTGLGHGANIGSIEFFKYEALDYIGGETFKIYIKNTSDPDWGTAALDWPTAITGATLVFDGAPQANVAGDQGFKKFFFSSPYTYDTTNGHNLAILVDYYQPTAQPTAISWLYDSDVSFPPYAANQCKYISGTGIPTNSLTSSNVRHPYLKINIPTAINMEATAVIQPSPTSTLYGSSPVEARYTNTGLNAISNGNAEVKIFDPGMSLVYTGTGVFASVLPNEFVDVPFSQTFTPTTSGFYTVQSVVSVTGDLYPGDDTLTTTINVVVPTFPVVICYSRATANERSNIDSVLLALATFNFTSFDTLNRDFGTPELTHWQTVIWCEESSIPALEIQAIEDFLDGGTTGMQKSLLIAGDDIGYYHGRLASTTYDSVFYSEYLHALYFADDGNGTADQSRICGVAVNPGLCDSLTSSFPDGIGVVNGSVVAYRFNDLPAASDTVISVAFDGTTYNVLYHAFEFREIVIPVTEDVSQIMLGSLSWIVGAGGSIPVELTSFTSVVRDNDVTLNWKTATETNNSSFVVERKSNHNSQFTQIANIPGRGTTTEPVSYSYTDVDLIAGTYTYRLKQIDLDGTFDYIGSIEVEVVPPKVFALEQNYPNPFNPTTTIKYSVPTSGLVNLSIFNVLGEKVTDLINKEVEAGSYELNFNASNLSSGVYFYKLEAGSFTSIKKMMLIK
ncbi:MAG: T9SS type A sorting domain-containing protein [Ignavibacteriales bacterium]|nr:T9SS type A sorting domain-containing protein [Ignavibacteriales bacterium]